MKDNHLLNKHILWRQHSSNDRYFYHYENDRIILLRINNFPDEPLYTLINGLEIFDIEDKPDNWVLEEIHPLRSI